jgi:hypothetical protein
MHRKPHRSFASRLRLRLLICRIKESLAHHREVRLELLDALERDRTEDLLDMVQIGRVDLD